MLISYSLQMSSITSQLNSPRSTSTLPFFKDFAGLSPYYWSVPTCIVSYYCYVSEIIIIILFISKVVCVYFASLSAMYERLLFTTVACC